MLYDYLTQCQRMIWEAVNELTEVLSHAYRLVIERFRKLEQSSKIRRRLWRRPENQRPHALFLDRRRKTYHCRNACAADYWRLMFAFRQPFRSDDWRFLCPRMADVRRVRPA